MLTYPDIDPVALSLGPIKVHWYGIMYLVGFSVAWWLGKLRSKLPNAPMNAEQVGDLIFYCALGAVLGGRLGYVFFYDFNSFLADPISLFKVWQGGMAFHGGLIGVIVSMILFARKLGRTFWEIADFTAPLTPIGFGAVRLANFINGELWGKVTDVPWGMVFPHAGALPRHPSQLYQSFFEGVILFLILWFFSKKSKPAGAVSGLFLLTYGSLRILAEFFRQPDAHIGYLAFGWVTQGQLLSVPMVIGGIGLMIWAYKKHPTKG